MKNQRLLLISRILIWMDICLALTCHFERLPTTVAVLEGESEIGVKIKEPLGLCHAGYSRSAEEYNLLTTLGNRWLRVDYSWSGIEPLDDQWNFEYWDNYTDTAILFNQKILAILDYSVPWLNNTIGNISNPPYIKPTQIPYFLDYVNQTVQRYKQKVAAWEIWNEPNIDFWKGSEEEFFLLFNQTATLIHDIDPTITIVGGVVNGHDTEFIEAMFRANIMTFVSAISFHPYTINVDEIYYKIQQVKTIGEKYHFQGEYWITEIGNPTGGSYRHAVPLDQQSERVIKSFVYATILNVSQIFWYCMYDALDSSKAAEPGNSELYFGLLYPNNTWKPGAYAFKAFSARVSNSSYLPQLISREYASPRDLQVFLYQRNTGERAIVLWYQPVLTRQDLLEINLVIQKNISNIEIFNYSRYTSAILSGSTLRVGYFPIIISYVSGDLSESIVISKVVDIWFSSLFFLPPLLVALIAISHYFHAGSSIDAKPRFRRKQEVESKKRAQN